VFVGAAGCLEEQQFNKDSMKAAMTKENHGAAEAAQKPERQYVIPEVNIFETREGYVLEAEMPGVSKDGLEVTLDNNELTLVGHRRQPPGPGNALVRESRNVISAGCLNWTLRLTRRWSARGWSRACSRSHCRSQNG